MVYGSVSRGFKSGGYNVDSISGTRPLNDPKVDLRFGKQTVTSTELGLKSEWMDRKIRLNAAVYSMDGTDWQVQQFITLPNGTAAPIITTAGKVRIDGAEFELQARPVSSVLLKAGVAYTDARFEEFKNANAAGEAYDGRPLTFSPRLKSSVSVEHLMPLGALQRRSSVSSASSTAAKRGRRSTVPRGRATRPRWSGRKRVASSPPRRGCGAISSRFHRAGS
jgi:iron complex outermembrane receptor protein